jgi:hypothetical protein
MYTLFADTQSWKGVGVVVLCTSVVGLVLTFEHTSEVLVLGFYTNLVLIWAWYMTGYKHINLVRVLI